MTALIFMFCCLIVLITMFATLRSAEKPQGNLLLGVTLPAGCMGESGVREILQRYHRAYLLLLGVGVLLAPPLLLLGRYVSFQLLYLAGWTAYVIGGGMHLLTRYFKKLYALKQARGWLVGEKHVVRVDTAVTAENRRPLSVFWLLPGLLFAIGTAALALLLERPAALGAALPPLICAALFFRKERNEVFSGESEENARRNAGVKRAHARCWAQLAALSGLTGFGVLLLPRLGLTQGLLVLCAADCALALWTLVAAHSAAQRACAGRAEELLVDDDQYWERGYYYNPDDPHLFVEKRVGYGWTVNVARPFGRVLNGLIVAVLIAVAALAVGLMRFDFGEITLHTEGNAFVIEAPVYSLEFTKEEIRSVEMLSEMPRATKRRGFNGDFLWLGEFRVEGYGWCRVFVYPKSGQVLAIKMEDSTVFLNGETAEQTAEFAELLSG